MNEIKEIAQSSNGQEKSNGTIGVHIESPPMPIIDRITGIEWIDNDGLLRDEGVLFGIAQADYSQKIDSIRNSFEKARSTYEIKQNQLVELIKEKKEEKLEKIKVAEQLKMEILEMDLNLQATYHRFFPTFIQLIIYAGISYFNYYLVSFWLSPVFSDRLEIPIGLYCLGLLSVYMGKAVVYNSNSYVQQSDDNQTDDNQNIRESWKVWLEELGLPLVVSSFIAILGFKYYPVEWSIGAFLLFFFLFSFSGKGLINSFYRTHKEFKSWWIFFLANLKRVAKVRGAKKKIKITEKEVLIIVEKITELTNSLEIPMTKINELNALLDYKINIFESEYKLANESKAGLSATQISSF